MSVGGSIESVSFDGRSFAVPADADVNRKLGGSENEVLPNGDGSGRLIKNVVPFGLSGLTVDVDDLRDDQTFLQALADGNEFFPVTITYASGRIFQGTGQITGELQFSNQTSTATTDVMGTGKMTPQ